MTGKAKPLSNLYLNSPKQARKTIAKLINEFHKGLIDGERVKIEVGLINKGLIQYDRLIHDMETDTRLELLENFIRGEGGTAVDPKDIDSVYAQDLRKQLTESIRENSELKNELMSIKRQLTEIQRDRGTGY